MKDLLEPYLGSLGVDREGLDLNQKKDLAGYSYLLSLAPLSRRRRGGGIAGRRSWCRRGRGWWCSGAFPPLLRLLDWVARVTECFLVTLADLLGLVDSLNSVMGPSDRSVIADTFDGPYGRWLLLSEIELAMSKAEDISLLTALKGTSFAAWSAFTSMLFWVFSL